MSLYTRETKLHPTKTTPVVWVLTSPYGPHLCRTRAEALKNTTGGMDEKIFQIELGTWNAKMMEVYSDPEAIPLIPRPMVDKWVWLALGCSRTDPTIYGIYESFEDCVAAIKQRNDELGEKWTPSYLNPNEEWSRGACGFTVDNISIRKVKIH